MAAASRARLDQGRRVPSSPNSQPPVVHIQQRGSQHVHVRMHAPNTLLQLVKDAELVLLVFVAKFMWPITRRLCRLAIGGPTPFGVVSSCGSAF
jgi:hypothetical protein